ncbi:HAMP domain-containing protein [Azospirillum halopraeferens]|uniref:HAMP domain-containing protein n=1 Tax=Azospirillum halopraeferens TaxID=34010 RepID=UPI000409A7B8|nr:HAMP domain-containing protein [Azospirillum halopraeferens]
MNLFARIWIMTSAAIALTVLTSVAAYEVIINRAVAEHGRADMLMYARLVAHAFGAVDDPTPEAVERLLASGPLIAVTLFDRDLNVVRAARVPGLADHEPERRMDRALLTRTLEEGIGEAVRVGEALYVATPVIDSQGDLEGVLAIAVPNELHTLAPGERLGFAAAMAVGVLAMGMIPAAALARRISRPIDTLVRVSESLRDGQADIDALSPLAHRRDEFGRLARGVLLLARTLKLTAERMDIMVEERVRALAGPPATG